MPNVFQQIVPAPLPADEIFATHQLAYEFRRESEYREELRQYCEWYYATAERHRQELEQMRGDINIFGWFNRLRGR